MCGESFENKIQVYTDGSYLGSTKKAGWAYVVVKNIDGELCIVNEKSGPVIGEKQTNNRGEFEAIAGVLENRDIDNFCIYSDSKYCIDSLTKWVVGWSKNGWVTANSTPVKNKDLIIRCLNMMNIKNVQFHHIKAHSGNKFNDRADFLAKQAAR